MKPPRWTPTEWAAANILLEARAAGGCERCGHECGPVERHHRKRRREGGDSLANLVMLGRPCHTHVHAHPVESRRLGFIVSMSRDPREVPLMWRRREWMQLDDDGNRSPLPAPEMGDAHA